MNYGKNKKGIKGEEDQEKKLGKEKKKIKKRKDK